MSADNSKLQGVLKNNVQIQYFIVRVANFEPLNLRILGGKLHMESVCAFLTGNLLNFTKFIQGLSVAEDL